jgi:hypothetical protein
MQFNHHSFAKKPAVIFFVTWSYNKSHLQQQDLCAPEILAANQQIQVTVCPNRGVTVERLGQHRTLQRKNLDTSLRKLFQQAFQFRRKHLASIPALLNGSRKKARHLYFSFQERLIDEKEHTMRRRQFQQRLPIHVMGNDKWRPAQTGYEQNSLLNALVRLFSFAHQISP